MHEIIEEKEGYCFVVNAVKHTVEKQKIFVPKMNMKKKMQG
jgi:hypothetical protein